jgi:hypothetical protein
LCISCHLTSNTSRRFIVHVFEYRYSRESRIQYHTFRAFGGRWGILHHIRHICTDRAVACESIMVTTSHALGRNRSRSGRRQENSPLRGRSGASGRIPTIRTAVASDLHRGQPSQARAHAARRGGALQFSTLSVSLFPCIIIIINEVMHYCANLPIRGSGPKALQVIDSHGVCPVSRCIDRQ